MIGRLSRMRLLCYVPDISSTINTSIVCAIVHTKFSVIFMHISETFYIMVYNFHPFSHNPCISKRQIMTELFYCGTLSVQLYVEDVEHQTVKLDLLRFHNKTIIHGLLEFSIEL